LNENLPLRTQPPLTRKNKTMWLALLPLLIIAGWWWKSHNAAPAKPDAAATDSPSADAKPSDAADKAAPIDVKVLPVALRPVENVVTAEGNLSAGQGASARIAVTAAGRINRVLVREGDRVQAGQLVAIVDNRAALAAERAAAADLTASLSDAKQAEIVIRATQSDQTNALRQAQLGLQSAIGERNGAIQQAENAFRSAQSDYRKAVSGAQTRDVTNAVQQARLGLRAATLDRDATIKTARNTLQTGRALRKYGKRKRLWVKRRRRAIVLPPKFRACSFCLTKASRPSANWTMHKRRSAWRTPLCKQRAIN